MTLSLSARPTIVAREVAPGRWDWLIAPDDVATLRLALADGLVGTAQRREHGGVFVLLAWSVGAQRAIATAVQAERRTRREQGLYLAPEGYTPRVYRAPAKPSAMRTIAAYEPAHW